MKKHTIVLFSCLPLLFSCLTSCEKHQHSFFEEWENDKTQHWHDANCGHNLKDALGNHQFGDDNICDVCGYKKEVELPDPHTHNFSANYSGNTDNHWKECFCGEKTLFGAHIDLNIDGKCDVCDYVMSVIPPHEHTFSEQWSSDENKHWHAATCEHTGEISSLKSHIFGDDDICDVCGFEKQPSPAPHEHTFSEQWSSNSSNHWHEATCEHTTEVSDFDAHYDNNEDYYCDVCNRLLDKGLDLCKLGPDEVFGHSRVTSLKNDQMYYLGVWKTESEKFYSINGEPYEDKGLLYPFYLSLDQISSKEDLEKCAKIQVHFVTQTKFTLQIFKEGASYDGCYISLYTGYSKYGNLAFSIYCSPVLGENHYNDSTESYDECEYYFEWAKECYDYLTLTLAVMFKNPLTEDAKYPKFLGTFEEYESLSINNTESLDNPYYYLAYLYEV